MTFIFATANEHKVTEINSLLPPNLEVISLREAGLNLDIEEPFDTIAENARHKARTVYELLQRNCFAEDTGLVTDALHGEPGVKSARYAGEGRSARENMVKLLGKLEGVENREARFITILCLIIDGEEFTFEGRCEGKITEMARGSKGFGYDPVFQPAGSTKTFAEMELEEKNWYSHRRKAFDQFIAFMKKHPHQ